MPRPYLRIDEPDGAVVEFTAYPHHMTLAITLEDEGRVHTNYALIPSEKLALLHTFLSRHVNSQPND
jgi:hypothetical protein